MEVPKIEGRKLSKEEYTIYLAKELSYKYKVRLNPKHREQALEMVKNGAFENYLKQYKKADSKENAE
jgi:hypothetical protein